MVYTHDILSCKVKACIYIVSCKCSINAYREGRDNLGLPVSMPVARFVLLKKVSQVGLT